MLEIRPQRQGKEISEHPPGTHSAPHCGVNSVGCTETYHLSKETQHIATAWVLAPHCGPTAMTFKVPEAARLFENWIKKKISWEENNRVSIKRLQQHWGHGKFPSKTTYLSFSLLSAPAIHHWRVEMPEKNHESTLTREQIKSLRSLMGLFLPHNLAFLLPLLSMVYTEGLRKERRNDLSAEFAAASSLENWACTRSLLPFQPSEHSLKLYNIFW